VLGGCGEIRGKCALASGTLKKYNSSSPLFLFCDCMLGNQLTEKEGRKVILDDAFCRWSGFNAICVGFTLSCLIIFLGMYYKKNYRLERWFMLFSIVQMGIISAAMIVARTCDHEFYGLLGLYISLHVALALCVCVGVNFFLSYQTTEKKNRTSPFQDITTSDAEN